MGSGHFSNNMQSVYLILVLVLGVLSQEQEGPKPPPSAGLCLDPQMMSAVCTINTVIGVKMETAHMNCVAAEQTQDRKRKGKPKGKGKGKNKGKGKKRCDVDLDSVSEFFADVWEKKACVLKEVGWVNDAGEYVPDNIMADIGTLDPRMREGMADTRELCANETASVTIESMLAGEDFVQAEIITADAPVTDDDDCKIKDLDQEKVVEIEDSLKKLSYIACIHGNFMTTCGNFIMEQMAEMVRYMTEGGFTSLPSQNTTVA